MAINAPPMRVFVRPVLARNDSLPAAKSAPSPSKSAIIAARPTGPSFKPNGLALLPTRAPLISKDNNKPLTQRIQLSRTALHPGKSEKPQRDALKAQFAGVRKTKHKPKAHRPRESPKKGSHAVHLASRYGTSPSKQPQTSPTRKPLKRSGESASKSKLLKKPKQPEKLEHPLSVYFKDASESYLQHATTHLPTALRTTVDAISSRLSAASIAAQTLVDSAATADKPFVQPFADEPLRIGADLHTTIGARVEAFENVVAAEEEKLRALWGRWKDVHAGLRDMADGNGAGVFSAQYRELEERYVAGRDEVFADFEGASADVVEELRNSEREYTAKRNKRRSMLMQLMQAELQE